MRATGAAHPNQVYKCRWCGFWHTGRWNPKPVQRGRR